MSWPASAGMMLAQLFVRPLDLPYAARLWMFFPLVLCIAAVYRATRARSATELLRPTLITFMNIVVGMCLIALAAYLVHQFVLWMW
jgi:hypothetical protein